MIIILTTKNNILLLSLRHFIYGYHCNDIAANKRAVYDCYGFDGPPGVNSGFNFSAFHTQFSSCDAEKLYKECFGDQDPFDVFFGGRDPMEVFFDGEKFIKFDIIDKSR
jgi:hypothetical protein